MEGKCFGQEGLVMVALFICLGALSGKRSKSTVKGHPGAVNERIQKLHVVLMKGDHSE